MIVFRYEVLDAKGNLLTGEIEAKSRRNAATLLLRGGQQLVSLEISKSEGRKKATGEANLDTSIGKVSLTSAQLIQFTEELSDMLDAGLTLEKSLGAIAKRNEVRNIRNVAANVNSRFSEGKSLADSLRASSDSFSSLYCNLVLAGEVAGSLSEILARQVIYLNTLNEVKGKLKTTMIYPIFLMVSAVGVLGVFAFVLVPRLQMLMEATGSELPFFASLMASGTAYLSQYWWQMIAGLVLGLTILIVFLMSPQGKFITSQFLVKCPGVRKIYKGFFNLHFTQTLSNLLSNGIKLAPALELCRGVTTNSVLLGILSNMIESANRGVPLNLILEKAKIFDRALIDMSRIGEDTGNLQQSLEKASHRLDRDFNRNIDRATALIQPVITILIATIVGFMAYMMVSVVYDTISTIRERQL